MIVKPVIGLNAALKFFKISRSKSYSWQFQIKFPCLDSFIGKCIKRWPNQTPITYINKIKELCSEPFFKGWPIFSIAAYAKRNKSLILSPASWYKYCKLIGISRKPAKKKRNSVGIRASFPNQIWHADVTIFKTLDNIKAYIYLVVDNYSRFILSCIPSLELSAKIRLKTIEDAFYKYKHIFQNNTELNLILDGGPENKIHLENISEQFNFSFKKLIAGKDIIFSNSMIESVNKLLKYRYLFIQNIPDFNALVRHLEYFIPIYNNIRPHVSLKGLTPYEVFTGKKLDTSEYKFLCKQVYSDRILLNQQSSCKVCEE